jgi:Spy/CpxP family protein refolding chaperone
MKHILRNFALSTALGATLFIAAQTPSSADEGWGRGFMGRWFMGEMMRDGWHYGMGGPGMMMRGKFNPAWLASIKDELNITDTQTKLWDDYVKQVESNFESMRGMHKTMMSRDVPEKLPDRLKLHEDFMAARHDSVKQANAALLALYNALNKEQQEKADAIFTGMGMI